MKLDDLPSDAKPPKLRAANVPPAAHKYIPLAELFGIADDGYRDSIVASLEATERMCLIEYLANYLPEVDEWLCGKEAESASPSDEYVAFTCLLLAAEYAKALHRR